MLLRRILRNAMSNAFRDTVELTQEEIDNILRKNLKQVKKDEQSENVFLSHPKEKSILEQYREAAQDFKPLAKQEIKSEAELVQEIKYGLPVKNVGFTIAKPESLPNTVTENVFEVLKLNEHTSYEEYETAISKFNSGMYVNRPANEQMGEIQKSQLGEQAIPMKLLNNKDYMEDVIWSRQLNLRMPGCIENEHSHRFMKIRPIEEFRHTPLIPISDKQMNEFAIIQDKAKSNRFYVVVSKQQIASFGFFCLIASIMIYMLNFVLKKEEEYGINFQRLKMRRMGMAYETV